MGADSFITRSRGVNARHAYGCAIEDAIEEHIKRQLNQDLYLEQRNILGCALKLVDWYTLFARAKENIKELV